MRRRFFATTLVAGIVAAVAAGGAIGEQKTIGNMTLTVDGSFSPKKLPKKKFAPITLNTEGHVTTDDSTTPPITDRVVIDFDKDGKVYTRGLPTCKTSQLINTLTQTALRRCKKALVGRGQTKATVDFPDDEPFVAAGPLLAFNGKPQGGKPVIIFHVYALVPLPTTFVVPAKITNAPGAKFGKRVTVNVPPISGGNGTLTDFTLKINKKWTIRKRGRRVKQSYLLAKCSDRKFLADAHVEWLDGRELDISLIRPCQPKR